MVIARPVLPVCWRVQGTGVCGSRLRLPDEAGCEGRAVLSLPTFTLGRGLSAQQRVSLCPGPRLVASLESGSWGGSSCPALSCPGRCSHVVGTGEGQGLLWLKAKAGTSREVALGSAFPSRDVKMRLQGRGISPSAWGEIPFP